ncbi:hypothetical protein ACFL6M_03835 [Candidatus Eisenbacteria bacterium]|uniref:Uncharacterized protein n=1 Tax=Eiseniibacteriota bacterium TaxID=2212470 RepID=A0ABV6YK59_UNCEI
MKVLLGALFLLALAGGTASASVPDAGNSTVSPADGFNTPRLVGIPSDDDKTPLAEGWISNTVVTVRDGDNPPAPIESSWVTLTIADPDENLCYCEQYPPVWAGFTDANGRVVLYQPFGGCSWGVSWNAVIQADGIPLRAFEWIVSPDWNQDSGNCEITISDFTVFGWAWSGDPSNIQPLCSDYDGNGLFTVVDLTLFGYAWIEGGCTELPSP